MWFTLGGLKCPHDNNIAIGKAHCNWQWRKLLLSHLWSKEDGVLYQLVVSCRCTHDTRMHNWK